MSDEKKPKAGIWALFAKLGTKMLSVFTKLIKSLKLVKVGLAAASLAGYAVIFSWKFGLLLMIAIGWHESGHVWAMKKTGMKTKGFYFLPFIGGAAIAEDEYKTYAQNAYISIMGPIWGAAMAWAAGGLYYWTHNPMWATAAAWMATLNLFNLLPITPLDGGQLVRSIAFSIHRTLGLFFLVVSLIAGAVVMWHFKIGLFVLLLVVGGLELFLELSRRFKMRKVQKGLLPKWKLPSHMLDDSQPDGLKAYPTSMKASQLAYTVLSYAGTIAILVLLLRLMAYIPGADLAAKFLE